MKRKDLEKKQTCPKCGGALRIVEADPTGRPWCDKPGCGYLGTATKTPEPAKWGPREDAHLAAIEKWLADDWRVDAEINAMLGTDGYVARTRAFGSPGLAWKKGLAILKAVLACRCEKDKGRAVERIGDKVISTARTGKDPRKQKGGKAKAQIQTKDEKRLVLKWYAEKKKSLSDEGARQAVAEQCNKDEFKRFKRRVTACGVRRIIGDNQK